MLIHRGSVQITYEFKSQDEITGGGKCLASPTVAVHGSAIAENASYAIKTASGVCTL